MSTSRDRRKAQTRSRLKEAALAAFSERGFAEASIGDVTRAAGVAQGTFYVHFASKEAVLDELLDDFNRGLVDAFGALDPALLGGPLGPLVEAMAGVFLDHWARHRGFVAVFAQRAVAGLRVEELRDGVNPAMHRFLVDLLAARAGSEADRATLALVAHAVLAVWLRLGMHRLSDEGSAASDRCRLPRLLADLTVGMLEATLSGGHP